MMENLGTLFMKLLVAQHVAIHQTVLQGLQHVSSHEGIETKNHSANFTPFLFEVHWDIISVDFIAELLHSHSYNVTMVVVDSVRK